MLFVSDETGSFDLARPSYDPSLWVTIAVPPATAAVMRAKVPEWCARWDVEELHAVQLSSGQRTEVASWLGGVEFIWKAGGTAQDLMSSGVAEGWRDDQAKEFRASYARSEARGSMDSRYVGRGEELYRLASNRRRVPPTAFVQYGIVAPKHFADVVQSAVRRYSAPEHASYWDERALVVDGKGVGRHGGPVLMTELLYPILATIPLEVPASMAVNHPLAGVHKGMPISEMFGGDPAFVNDSSSEPLIQIADLIAWVVRRRLTHPNERSTEEVYRRLLRRCPEVDGLRVRMMWRNGFEPTDLQRYRVLLP